MVRIRGKRLFAALICLVFVSCSNGPGPAAQPTSLATDQTLRFPIQHDVTSLDPAMIDSEAEAEIAQNLFDGLLKFDGNLNVVPDIALSMPSISSDGATYTFKLRQDVAFSNGDKVTSKDVLYSWNRSAAMQGPYAANLSAITGYDHVATNQVAGAALEALLDKSDPAVTMVGLTAPDAYTIVAKLTGAAGWFQSAIAQPSVSGMIIDQKVVKSNFDSWWSKPDTLVGTGAFKMSARTANNTTIGRTIAIRASTITRIGGPIRRTTTQIATLITAYMPVSRLHKIPSVLAANAIESPLPVR